jgi:hypothetical protein
MLRGRKQVKTLSVKGSPPIIGGMRSSVKQMGKMGVKDVPAVLGAPPMVGDSTGTSNVVGTVVEVVKTVLEIGEVIAAVNPVQQIVPETTNKMEHIRSMCELASQWAADISGSGPTVPDVPSDVEAVPDFLNNCRAIMAQHHSNVGTYLLRPAAELSMTDPAQQDRIETAMSDSQLVSPTLSNFGTDNAAAVALAANWASYTSIFPTMGVDNTQLSNVNASDGSLITTEMAQLYADNFKSVEDDILGYLDAGFVVPGEKGAVTELVPWFLNRQAANIGSNVMAGTQPIYYDPNRSQGAPTQPDFTQSEIWYANESGGALYTYTLSAKPGEVRLAALDAALQPAHNASTGYEAYINEAQLLQDEFDLWGDGSTNEGEDIGTYNDSVYTGPPVNRAQWTIGLTQTIDGSAVEILSAAPQTAYKKDLYQIFVPVTVSITCPFVPGGAVATTGPIWNVWVFAHAYDNVAEDATDVSTKFLASGSFQIGGNWTYGTTSPNVAHFGGSTTLWVPFFIDEAFVESWIAITFRVQTANTEAENVVVTGFQSNAANDFGAWSASCDVGEAMLLGLGADYQATDIEYVPGDNEPPVSLTASSRWIDLFGKVYVASGMDPNFDVASIWYDQNTTPKFGALFQAMSSIATVLGFYDDWVAKYTAMGVDIEALADPVSWISTDGPFAAMETTDIETVLRAFLMDAKTAMVLIPNMDETKGILETIAPTPSNTGAQLPVGGTPAAAAKLAAKRSQSRASMTKSKLPKPRNTKALPFFTQNGKNKKSSSSTEYVKFKVDNSPK